MEIVSRQYTPHPQIAWENWSALSSHTTAQIRYLVRPESNTAHEFWLEASVFEMTDGEPGSRIISLRDVTAEILNRRNTRSFGEAINHKVRTPVTHMISSLDLLVRHAPKFSQEEVVKLSETALKGAKRLYETLDRVLKYTKVYTNVDCTEGFELSGFKELLEKIASEIGDINISMTMPEVLAKVQLVLSYQSMEALLWEILGNSKKFHPSNTPKVTVEVSPGNSPYIILQFSDDGISLLPKQLSTA